MTNPMPECPFCRSNEHVRIGYGFIGEIFTFCAKCDSRGPSNLYERKADAIESWASIQRDRARLAQLEAQIAAIAESGRLPDGDGVNEPTRLWAEGLGDAPDPEAAQ